MRLADYVEKHFGARPRGAWLAERVWEPEIPSSLAPAGVEYTLVDDNHFLGAGFELDQLYGYCLAEDLGHAVKLLPGLKSLRYLIPFRDEAETAEFLRGAARQHPGGFAAMGDDLEKFGVWPGTYEHCYTNGWLERFFSVARKERRLARALHARRRGRFAPAARPRGPSDGLVHRDDGVVAADPGAKPLPRPGRGVCRASRRAAVSARRHLAQLFHQVRESNLMHKKMLHVSAKVRRLAQLRRRDKAFLRARREAATLLLRGQCNDPYWHGIFGGLYSPHLRTAVWLALAEAETIADRLAHRKREYADAEKLDFDSDGRDEIYLTSDRYAALIAPDDGGTISALDFRPPNVTLINSLMRRPESYHAKLRNLTTAHTQGAQSIHDQVRVKEDGLERWLNYDRWPRNMFRLLLFGQGKTQQDCASVQLEEDAALAGGRYRVTAMSPSRVALVSEDSVDWPAEKTLSFAATPGGFDVVCDVALRRSAPGTASVNVGIEVVVNLLAPSAPDRYFETGGQRFPLRWSAAMPGAELRAVDEWQKVSVAFEASGARQFWISPIETVSESEDGFERIYQGSQVIAVWPVELAQGAEWKCRLSLKVSHLA